MGREDFAVYSKAWKPPTYTVDESGKVVDGYRPAEPNNWDRWGSNDQRGTANLVTEEAVRAAAGLVNRGKVLSLAIPIDTQGPTFPGRSTPKHYFTMTGSDLLAGSPYNAAAPGFTFNDDNLDMCTQGSTQWDGLGHVAVSDTHYNGYWTGNITAFGGAGVLGIQHQKTSFVGRGVLLDVARHRGVDWLESGFEITAAMLDEVAAAQGVEFRSGDVILLRTGYLAKWWKATTHDEKMEWLLGGEPGIGPDTVEWLHSHDIAAVAADTIGLEVMPSVDLDGAPLPVHRRGIVDLGITFGELWELDELAGECAADGNYAFLLVAPPLVIANGVGSMLNPIAIK